MALIPIPPSAPTRVMTGATAVADGKAGSVTKPVAGDHLKFLRGDGTFASVSASDRRNSTTSRANATAGAAPTVGEHASPIDGDTHTIILNNGNVEYYKYTTVWGLVATVVPVTFDGSHTPISRANALTNIAPTIGEVPSPVEGDSASVFLNDGTIENWYRNATVWALINTITPVTSDGNSTWISRANATTGVAPTVGEVSAPVSGDTAIVLLNNGTKEYWTRTTVWTLTATEVAAGSSILQADGTQTANRTHDFANFDQTWNDVANFTKNVVDGSEVTNLSYTVSTETSQVNFSPDVHNLVVNDGAGSSSALTITPALSKLEVNGGGLNKASYSIEDGTVGDAVGDPQLYLKTNAVSNGTAVAGQVLTLNAATGESEFATPSASSADTIQTAASTGTTAITAWGSVVLIPTLAANITLTYPTPVGNIGKTIKVVRTGTPNGFTVTHTPAVGTITLMSTGSEINTVAGAFTVEAIDATNIRQVSNAVSAASLTDLTFGRVKATANLSNIAYATATPGTKVPFDTAFYFSGTIVGNDSVTVSQTGRYRCSWFMMAGSGDFNGDGTFHVVSGGVSLGSVFIDIMQAAGVNQIANFIDVNLDAGATVALHYQPVVADAVPWGAGSYFQVDQLPTAVAPVVNTVAEYGSSILAATNVDVNVSVGNWVTLAGLSTTLPSAGTYRLFWKASGEMADAGTTEVVVSGRLRNNTAGVDYTDSRAVIVGKDSPTASVFTSIATGSGEAIVTVTGTSEIVFQTRTSALATVSSVILGDGNLRSAAYISYEKIAGQLPSTGATVDYLSAGRTTDQVTAVNGVTVVLNSAINGNVPLNTSTGFITLSAGKTYEITASVAVQSNSANTQQSFLVADSAGTTALVAGASFGVWTGTANVPYSGGSTFIYTPTVNQDIRLYFVGGGGTVTFKANGAGGGTSGGTLLTVRQIGSSNAIVTDNVALFGEQSLTATTIGSATVDITNGSFTLPSAGTWEVEYFGNISLNAGNISGGLLIADISNVEVANSRSVTGAGASGGGNENAMVSNKVRIITSAPTTYKIRGIGNAANIALSTGLAIGGVGNKVTWNLIAGTVPSTGQTVDYIEVGSASGLNIPTLGGANTALLWGAVKSGNIPYNAATGQFTLTAGKTYKFEAETAQASTSIYWWNATANATLNTNTAGSNSTYSGEAKTIFTPTVTTLVELRGSTSSYNAGNSDTVLSTKANIVQLGSTSNTVGTLPAVDQSSAGYFDVGNMRMQWGQGVATVAAPLTVNLVVPFANANYSLTGSVIAGGDHRWTRLVSQASSSFSMGIITAAPSFATGTFNWFAIGQKP